MPLTLVDLPFDLLDDILDYLVPYGWNCSSDGPSCLELRLVCGLFDSIISRWAFLKLDRDRLGVAHPWDDSPIPWLLRTKIEIGYCDPLDLSIHQSVSSILDWRDGRGNIPIGSRDARRTEYINAACRLAIASKGLCWVCDELALKSGRGRAGLQPPSTEIPGDLEENDKDQRAIKQMMSSASLQVASYKGDVATVKVLMANGTDPSVPHEYLGYALYAAAYSDNTEIARLLLEHGADLGCVGYRGTPLEAAAHQGHVDVMKLLVEKEGGVNKHFNLCLLYSVKNRHVQAVQLLLDLQDLNPNRKDDRGETPLMIAVRRGYSEIVPMLLKRDDIRPSFEYRQTCSICITITKGYADMLGFLLDRFGFSERHDCNTSLRKAVSEGHEAVVRLLLARDDVDPNRFNGRFSPFFTAVNIGHTAIAELFLARSDVNPNEGLPPESPLSRAARNDDEAMVRLLLSYPRVNPNGCDYSNPLGKAAEEGYVEIVRLLLGRKDINPNAICSPAGTPLANAARVGNLAVVQLLLARDDVDPNKANALHMAVRSGNDDVVQQFLLRRDIDVNLDGAAGTPLWQAATQHSVLIVMRLLARTDIDPNMPTESRLRTYIPVVDVVEDDDPDEKAYEIYWEWAEQASSETPLSAATRRNRDGILRELLDDPRVDPSRLDPCGRSALWWSAFYGNPVAARLLLARGMRPNVRDNFGWTPLLAAASNGHDYLVKLLLDHEGTNPNIPEPGGWTPLLVAANGGNTCMVSYLLRHPRIDVDRGSSDGTTPWMLAQQHYDPGMFELFRRYWRRSSQGRRN